MAEISVPAWPIPIHQTKLMMSYAQPTGMLLPQTPIAAEHGVAERDDEEARACHRHGEARPPALAGAAATRGPKRLSFDGAIGVRPLDERARLDGVAAGAGSWWSDNLGELRIGVADARPE
jgi:hypothetical protein